MAGNTIAKLAVVVTTDTTPMAAGMQRAGTTTKNLADRIQAVDPKVQALGRSFISASHGFGRFGGVAGAFAATGGPIGIAAAGMAAATAAAGGFLLKIANLNDAAQDLKIQSWRDYADAFEKLNGVKLTGHMGELQKTSEAWARLKDQVGEYAQATELSTNRVANFLSISLMGWTHILGMEERIASIREDNEQTKKRDEETKAMLEQFKQQTELEKTLDEQRLARIREQGKAFEETAKRAAAIFDSVKTPEEKFDEKLADLIKMVEQGFLNDETFERAFRKAQEELNKKDKTTSAIPSSVGAVERFTMAGFSAVQRAQESKKLEKNTERTAVAAEKTVKAIEGLAQRQGPAINLTVSNF